jgi:hypothetical protein
MLEGRPPLPGPVSNIAGWNYPMSALNTQAVRVRAGEITEIAHEALLLHLNAFHHGITVGLWSIRAPRGEMRTLYPHPGGALRIPQGRWRSEVLHTEIHA